MTNVLTVAMHESDEIQSSSTPEPKVKEEVSLTAENLIAYDVFENHEPIANDTANFGSCQRSDKSSEHSDPPEESAYFTIDPHVIQQASYGELKEHEKIEQRLLL
jgi:hypothetical protein